MSGPLLLGIDEGTTAVKAVLFDEGLRPLASARREVAVHHPAPGRVEKDPLEILDAVIAVVAELLAQAPGPVAACGLDHEGESILAWDAVSGAPLSPVLVWQDKRGEAVLDTLSAEARQDVAARSGLPLDPYFSASKLSWLLVHDAAVRAARDAGRLRLGTVDAFLSDRLGAGFATDASTASRTQLHRPGTGGWDPVLLGHFGIDEALLPAVADSAGDLGTLRHERWPTALPLRARLTDQQAALAGSGCVAPGLVKATYGTGVFVLAVTGSTPPRVEGLLPTVAWRLGGRDTFAVDGGVFAAGAMLAWLCDELGLAERPEDLGALARTVEDAGGARLLPALAGLGAPWWDPGARAVLAGIDGATTRAHLARAAFEGIAWRVADIVERMRNLHPVSELRVDGGLTNEPLLAELQADAAGVRVRPMRVDATATGAAGLAAVGAGLLDGIDALTWLLPAGDAVEPRHDATWRSAQHAAWRQFAAGAAALR